MRKQCRECRTTTTAEAPYCEACGSQFVRVPPVLIYDATWQGRAIAATCGMLAAMIVRMVFA